jgi:hypothetical protein
MNVIKQRLIVELGFPFDDNGFVAIPKEASPFAMPHIESPRQGVLQPLHAGDQICFRGLQHQMVMIAHQNPGTDAPAGLRTRFAERPHKEMPIQIVKKDPLPAIAASHHMIIRARKLESQQPRHCDEAGISTDLLSRFEH